ncbi:MAG: hypothetical protein IKT92_02745 [Bacteroidaceae bacterium]|nr:hypothetical protein [Bacteroidaceae bacterium]
MNKKILLVHRAHRFSPNCVERDAAVLSAIQQALEARDFHVQHIDEDAITDEFLQTAPPLIISMARSKDALVLLEKWEQQEGHTVLNSAKSVLVNTRAKQVERFFFSRLPIPSTEVTYDPKSTTLNFPLWVKMGGGDAETASDVRYYSKNADLQNADFEEHQIYVLSEHVVGDLVKFYGVAGTPFFYVYYPTNFSKFGLEKYNGTPQGYSFDRIALQQIATKAAALCGVTLYGGDCIVRPDGTFALIDFNDFPSFAPCANEAAKALVDCIINNYV